MTEPGPDRDPSDQGSTRMSTSMLLRLWWNAVTDRRAGLPSGGDDGTSRTPCVEELDRRRLEAIERERGQLVAATAPMLIRLQVLDVRIDEARRAVDDVADPGQPPPRVSRDQRRLRLSELRSARATLDEQIVRRCVAAQSRAVQVDEFMRQRCARYARTLLRHHPDAPALTRAGWPALGGLPAWVHSANPTAALSFSAVSSDLARGAT